MKPISIYRWAALAGYFSLLLSLYLLLFIFNKPEPHNMLPALVFYIGPLMFPLRGLLNGRAYTHAWAGYMALFYFIVGVWYAGAEVDRLIGLLITFSSIVFFIGAIMYARTKGKADRLADTTDND